MWSAWKEEFFPEVCTVVNVAVGTVIMYQICRCKGDGMCNSIGCTVFIFCVAADSFNLRCTSWSQVSISVVSGSIVTLRCKDSRLSEGQTNALSRRADCQRS